MATEPVRHAARLEVDYPERMDRFTTFFRAIWIIPIVIIISLLTDTGPERTVNEAGETIGASGSGIQAGLVVATGLMILFRRRYPRWWFDFVRELTRFESRVLAYLACLTDQYPSTVEEQSVHLEIDYPDVQHDLNRWLPLVKWLLAIPHYIVLAILAIFAIFAVILSWFAILFTGRYPRAIFNYIEGVTRWWLRVEAYVFLLITDKYPPFRLS